MNYAKFTENSLRIDQRNNAKNHFFSCHFSKPVAYVLYLLGLSPNAVTFTFLLAGACVSISVHLGLYVWAYVFWRLHIILDMADGDVARATSVYSRFAVGFDRTNHIIINNLLLFSLASASELNLSFILLLIAFQIYYNFDRNFEVKLVGEKVHLSQRAIFLKNIMTLEGYLVVSLSVLLLNKSELLTSINAIYFCSFSLLSAYKFKRGFF